jgi:hypothetical protein
VTVTVTRADGTVLVASTGATGAGTGIYTLALTKAQTEDLDLLTATWSAAGVVLATTHHEIVGGVYFTVAQARLLDRALTLEKASNEAMVAGRREVEEQCEAITKQAWVPRFRRVELTRTQFRPGYLVLPDPFVRRIRSIDLVDAAGITTAWTGDVDDIGPRRDGVITAPGATTFDAASLVIAYEHGHDRPPENLVRAGVLHLRHQLGLLATSSTMDRATQTSNDGQTVLLATPGRFGFDTGIPSVDAVYQRHAFKEFGIA